MNNTDADKLRQALQEIEALKRGETLPQVSRSGPLPPMKAASPAPQPAPTLRARGQPAVDQRGSPGLVSHHHLMKAKQKQVLMTGIAVAVMMGVFPPWTDTFFFDSGAQGRIQSQAPARYSFILVPPQAPEQVQMFHTFTIDIGRLFVQWVIVALAVGGGLVYFGEPAGKSEDTL
jgi:hypothetical protein